MKKIYISFYEYVTIYDGNTLHRLKHPIGYMRKMVGWIEDEIEDKEWELKKHKPTLGGGEIPYGVYLSPDDALMFKLKFNI